MGQAKTYLGLVCLDEPGQRTWDWFRLDGQDNVPGFGLFSQANVPGFGFVKGQMNLGFD